MPDFKVRPLFLVAAQGSLAYIVGLGAIGFLSVIATKSRLSVEGWVIEGAVGLTLLPWAFHQAWICLRSCLVINSSGVNWKDCVSAGASAWSEIGRIGVKCPVGAPAFLVSLVMAPQNRFTVLELHLKSGESHVIFGASQLGTTKRDMTYEILCTYAREFGVEVTFPKNLLTTVGQNDRAGLARPYGVDRWRYPPFPLGKKIT